MKKPTKKQVIRIILEVVFAIICAVIVFPIALKSKLKFDCGYEAVNKQYIERQEDIEEANGK